MAWGDVEWSNGDVPTSVKGNQMQDNLDYVREVLRVRTAAQEASNITAQTQLSWNLVVNIGPLEFTSSAISSTSFAEVAGSIKNQDISSLTVGVPYTLIVSAQDANGKTRLMASTFIMHEDANYLSVFGKVRKDQAGSHLASVMGYTALVTRDNEGF